MNYLHKSELKVHGNLKSKNCVVDSRWTVKLQEFGTRHVISFPKSGSNFHNLAQDYYCGYLWTPPEYLRNSTLAPTQKGDVYSFAIVLKEIITQSRPFSDISLSSQEIVQKVNEISNVPFRPSLRTADGLNEGLVSLITNCWDDMPEQRPDFFAITALLAKETGRRNVNLIDNMINLLEKHANNLEEIVSQRTKQLAEEKEHTDKLLYQMLPQQVADGLKKGLKILAEHYDHVTIYFSDIVGFTSISSVSTPFQVVNMLNQLYTMFDTTIEDFDVYKVETIGDAYMVVSGLPLRNGDAHACEIVNMSMKLLADMSIFRIPHLLDRKMLLRIGLHTGPCVAGVVGLKMPRYCLFGDTVNIAQRLESTGEALKIHVSESTVSLLKKNKNKYKYTERGIINLKGNGAVRTYWLTEKAEMN